MLSRYAVSLAIQKRAPTTMGGPASATIIAIRIQLIGNFDCAGSATFSSVVGDLYGFSGSVVSVR